MSRIKHPREKKRASLDRDHRTLTLEGNKSFRVAWRRKKALANRRFRRKSIVRAADTAEAEMDAMPLPRKAKRFRSLKKFGVASLSQSIAIKVDKSRLRWSSRVLKSNPAALKAGLLRKQPPSSAKWGVGGKPRRPL